jgi:hypothetical protein
MGKARQLNTLSIGLPIRHSHSVHETIQICKKSIIVRYEASFRLVSPIYVSTMPPARLHIERAPGVVEEERKQCAHTSSGKYQPNEPHPHHGACVSHRDDDGGPYQSQADAREEEDNQYFPDGHKMPPDGDSDGSSVKIAAL